MICHVGSTSYGHYYSIIRHKDANKWIKYNDTVIKEIGQSDVNTQDAYILFYMRADLEDKDYKYIFNSKHENTGKKNTVCNII